MYNGGGCWSGVLMNVCKSMLKAAIRKLLIVKHTQSKVLPDSNESSVHLSLGCIYAGLLRREYTFLIQILITSTTSSTMVSLGRFSWKFLMIYEASVVQRLKTRACLCLPIASSSQYDRMDLGKEPTAAN
jgi:hypothetical protein